MIQTRALVKNAFFLILAVALLANASALQARSCSTSALTSAATLQQLTEAPQYSFVLKPGDGFVVSVYGVKKYDVKGRIATDGTAILPLIGKVTLSGLTVEQAQNLIADKLVQSEMFESPQVSFVVLDSPNNVVSMAGELNRPGTFPDLGKHTIYEFIAGAGGLTHAACHVITLNRPGLGHPVLIPLGPDPAKSEYANMPIFPGDSIYVPASGVVYVVGAVKTEGAYALKSDSPTTVMQAVTMAGGVGYQAAYGSTVIVRNVPNGREEIALNLKSIAAGKQADPVLLPNDILLVPTNKMKAALKSGAAGIAAAIASAYIYAAHP